ncbi:3',5'-cyclic AMP phosphodiesterase CpdA [Ilumatobacter fluminis]|uniref:3',5'-cyclic AMP phosphodiesterase CpdA n=1 Tax=Ilumatobacter fluminis TaxID=467091 RepID=A0A4R7HZF1_9ACTN|nr:phosphodiesterase [Ilumatobacter fluminis]TDT16495.1 3',5'-cyclic AMP phosphodiesterase CpdA [Ilumatobacter fluminis]
MRFAQITDCHITEPGDLVADRVDPTDGLRRAVDRLAELGSEIDVVLATGDLTNDGRPGEYDVLERLLERIPQRIVVVPGNHDDRGELRRRFDLPVAADDDPIDHVVDLGDCRLVCLDTTVPGRNDGRVTIEQLTWLDTQIAERIDVPAIVVQHHPPFASGIESMDQYGLDGADIEADIVSRHRHVAGIVGGHYHRPIARAVGGTVAFACPSTAVQLHARLGDGPTTYADDPPAFALHELTGGSLTSHVVQLRETTSWVPSWAM